MAHPLYALIFAPPEREDTGGHGDTRQRGTQLDAPRDARRSASDTTDLHLVARVQAGDPDALGTIFTAYYAPLVAYAESYTGIRADAEEIVAELFAWIWTNRARWTVHDTGVRAYLYRGVRNRVLNRGRDERRATTRYLRLAREEHAVVMPAQPIDAPAHLVEAEAAEAFARALSAVLAHLTPGVREVVSLYANSGLTFDEIATTTGSSVTAVRMQWSRGLKVLREELPRLLSTPES